MSRIQIFQYHGCNMKKKLFIISVIVVIVSIFVSCSANSSSENANTTAVTDIKGITHYYEIVTDNHGNVSTTENEQGVFAEIETQSNGKAVTKKNGTYVTNENTTILTITEKDSGKTTYVKKQKRTTTTINDISINSNSTTKKVSTTKNVDNADNNIEFKTPADVTSKSTVPATTESTVPITTTNKTNQNEESTSDTTSPTKITTDKDGWIDKWY